ncbi:MAG TPA: pyridoxamine 5'-phosphate oxidase family protein [Stellaceae bacterium]|nr:pyridoxamine 5'-phosphate oxidase family protein [Stellaceae bacterium]
MGDMALTPGRQVERLLAAARDTIAEVPYCWVVTAAEDGGAHARVVKAFPNGAGEDFWTRWFLTRRLSRKSAEIRRVGRVTLAYQHNSGRAYVALAGRAELVDERAAVECRWSAADETPDTTAAQLIAVRVMVDHIEIHVCGVAAEPWGHGRTLLERNGEGAWRLLPE